MPNLKQMSQLVCVCELGIQVQWLGPVLRVSQAMFKVSAGSRHLLELEAICHRPLKTCWCVPQGQQESISPALFHGTPLLELEPIPEHNMVGCNSTSEMTQLSLLSTELTLNKIAMRSTVGNE